MSLTLERQNQRTQGAPNISTDAVEYVYVLEIVPLDRTIRPNIFRLSLHTHSNLAPL